MSPSEAITGDDGLGRCPWATSHPMNLAYHDAEWGRPVRGEAALLERLSLEAFQSGLSWLTILAKRPAFRTAFHGFDADAIAAMGDDDVERLMLDASIVRNRAKILATRTNAQATVALRADGGLDEFLWSRVPPATPPPRTTAELLARTPESTALSKELKKRGFAFVGPTTMYALMTAVGIADGHLAGCYLRGTAAGGD